jgi:photosystem II stability/assembly factor-like uncharacterized protein
VFAASVLHAQEHDTLPQGWYRQNLGNTGRFGHIFFKNRDTGYVTAGTTYTLITTNGGNSWQVYSDSIAVTAFIGSFGYGTCIKGLNYVAITNDNGLTWNYVNIGNSFGINPPSLYFSSQTRGFCFGSGYITMTTDGGRSWKQDSIQVGGIERFVSFDSLHIVASGQEYYIPKLGQDVACIWYSSDGGESWKFTMDDRTLTVYENWGLFVFAAFDSATVYMSGGGYPKVYQTSNRGYSITPFNMSNAAFVGSDVALAGSAFNHNNITVVGTSGIISRTFDGVSWTKQNSGTTNTLYSVCFVDSLSGWAVGDGGIILHTVNGGFDRVSNQASNDTLHIDAMPNPSSDILSIQYTLPVEQHINVQIVDLLGRTVSHPVVNDFESRGEHSLQVDVHSLPSGAYLLRLQTELYQTTANCSVIH